MVRILLSVSPRHQCIMEVQLQVTVLVGNDIRSSKEICHSCRSEAIDKGRRDLGLGSKRISICVQIERKYK